ncbi:unnamed protein product [Adineta steineri]|uniref:Uncharacterized protein n=1 Tax=Adineta steineri TaxID=433720 RepID=A0A819XCM9_9BILA|nr:unnamed protein product [Adineta steineri]
MSSYCLAFVAIIAVIGTIVVDDASGTFIATASVSSHTCSSKDSKTITGSLILSNVVLALLAAHKSSIASCFTSQLRLSSSLNIKAAVQVHGYEQLANGDCRVSYTCSGIGHHPSALTCLKAVPSTSVFKTTLGKCSHSSGTKVGVGGGLGIGLLGGGLLKGIVGGILNVGSSLTRGLLAAVTSHTCSSKDSKTITGSFIIIDVDLPLLIAQKDSIALCFTNQLRLSSSLNIKAIVQVHGFERITSGHCRVSYTCSGVGHHPSALTCLKAAPNTDEFKNTLRQCSRSVDEKVGASSELDESVDVNDHIYESTNGDAQTDVSGQFDDDDDQDIDEVDLTVDDSLNLDSSSTDGSVAAVTSHKCSSTDSKTITGSLIICNADKIALTSQKDSITSCFTNQLRLSSSLNVKAIVEVHGFEQLDNGDCRVSYKCSGVGHRPSALTCLKASPITNVFRTILGKCSRSSGGKIGVGGLLNVGSSLIDGLIAAVTSHKCSSTDSKTVTGSLIICNADKIALTAEKNSFESCFTSQLRLSSSLNTKATTQVHGFEQLANGDCRVSYSCSGVGHHPSALTCLKATPNTNAFKTILGKCSHSKGGH